MAWSEIQSVLCGPSTVSVESLGCFPNCYSLVRLSAPNCLPCDGQQQKSLLKLCQLSAVVLPLDPRSLTWTCTVQGSAKDWRIISTHISGLPTLWLSPCQNFLLTFRSLVANSFPASLVPWWPSCLCELTEALQAWSSDQQHSPHVETG